MLGNITRGFGGPNRKVVLAELFSTAFRDGGSSLSPRTGERPPKHGYMVGGYGSGFVVDRDAARSLGLDALVRKGYLALRDWWVKADESHTYLGAWIHDGKLYFELSERYGSRERALAVARERGELAIYDLEREEDIPVV